MSRVIGEGISPFEMPELIADMVNGGAVVAVTDNSNVVQFLEVDNGGHGTVFEMPAPYGHFKVTEGFSMTGVMRRARIFRRFVECDRDELAVGDRVILEDGEGIRKKSNRVIEILR